MNLQDRVYKVKSFIIKIFTEYLINALINLLNKYKILLLVNNTWKLTLIEKFKKLFILVVKEITQNKLKRLVIINNIIIQKI